MLKHIIRLSVLALVLTATWPAAAAKKAVAAKPATPYALTVATDHPDALYHQGETITYTIKLTLDQKPVDGAEVAWVTTKDGVDPKRSGKVTVAAGTATVTGKLDEPGFMQCRVTFTTPEKVALDAIAGAGIDPLQIKPSLPVPDDFDAFWDAQKKKLAAVPMNPKLTPAKSSAENIEVFDVKVDCLGAPVSGYFARPKGAKAKSLPIVLTLHGAGVRSASWTGPDSWAKQGFLAMDINAHGLPNGQPDSFYDQLANGELKDYRARGAESRDTVYFLGMFLRVIRAIDFLTAQPEWNGRTVVATGSSQGGFQTLFAAGIDSRVSFFAAGVPAGCDHTGFLVGRVNGWPKFFPTGTDAQGKENVLAAVRYFDNVNFATRIKVPGLVTVGFIDTTCPPSSVYAAYNAIRTPKQIFNDPPSPHHMSDAASAAVKAAILKHAKTQEK